MEVLEAFTSFHGSQRTNFKIQNAADPPVGFEALPSIDLSTTYMGALIVSMEAPTTFHGIK